MSIEIIRTQLQSIDARLLELLQLRWSLMQGVSDWKREHGSPIHVPPVEAANLGRIRNTAIAYGLDPGFALEIFSVIIKHSKERQCVLLDKSTVLPTHRIARNVLHDNLLALTESIASRYQEVFDGVNDDEGIRRQDALQLYRRFEEEILVTALQGIPDRGLAVDIGCAAGGITERFLQTQFDAVYAFDASEHMVVAARDRRLWQDHVKFTCETIDGRLPVETSAASLLVANFGAASEIIPNHWAEIKRVLKPGGKAFLSFYNTDALSNHWYYPGPSTLRSRYNQHNETIETWVDDNAFTLFAQGVCVDQVKTQAQSVALHVETLCTFPTLYTLLPRYAMTSPRWSDLCRVAEEIDRGLASSDIHNGTYLIAVVANA